MGGVTDAAIERWANMRKDTVRHFKINARTTRQLFVYGILIPVVIYEASIAEFVRLPCCDSGRAWCLTAIFRIAEHCSQKERPRQASLPLAFQLNGQPSLVAFQQCLARILDIYEHGSCCLLKPHVLLHPDTITMAPF